MIITNEGRNLHSKIDEIMVDLNDYHSKTLQEGTSLKSKIDAIEKCLANGQKNEEMKRQTASASKRLDALVDSLILTSGKLNELKDSCERIEDLMTSLLCYSLSRFREKGAKIE